MTREQIIGQAVQEYWNDYFSHPTDLELLAKSHGPLSGGTYIQEALIYPTEETK